MKLQCRRKDLLAAFNRVISVVPSRSPKPILQNLLLTVDDDLSATLSATDLEVGIRHRVSGITAYESGAVILPTVKLQQILSTSTDDDLDIETDAATDKLIVRGSRARFALPSENADLFPEVPGFTVAAYHAINAGDLRKLIRRTIFATDVESTRYALGGVLVELADDSITMVGTDGRRLAKMVAPAEAIGGAVPPLGSPVIPVKALKLIDRNLDDPELTVHLAFQSGTSVLVRIDDELATIYSRLVEGRFPKYHDVFPDAESVVAKIPLDVPQFRQAVGQASILVSEESRGVDFLFAGDLLTLSSEGPDLGSSQVTMPIHRNGDGAGGQIDITFDPRYLTDALKTIEDDAALTVDLIDHKNAAVFRVDGGYDYVVMPLTRDR